MYCFQSGTNAIRIPKIKYVKKKTGMKAKAASTILFSLTTSR